jgi:hypothetical protein
LSNDPKDHEEHYEPPATAKEFQSVDNCAHSCGLCHHWCKIIL